ncbi:MAG: protein phosphatase 2C domain-containing protein [Tetrasphaera sp.]
MPLKVIAAGRTDVGLHREHNEDSFALLDRHGLFLVADGMGGHRAGDVASKMATETVARVLRQHRARRRHLALSLRPRALGRREPAADGHQGRQQVHLRATARASDDHRGMGTTVVGVLVAPRQRAGLRRPRGRQPVLPRARRRASRSSRRTTRSSTSTSRAMPDLTAGAARRAPAQRDHPRPRHDRARCMVDLSSRRARARATASCSAPTACSGMISDDGDPRTLLAHAATPTRPARPSSRSRQRSTAARTTSPPWWSRSRTRLTPRTTKAT